MNITHKLADDLVQATYVRILQRVFRLVFHTRYAWVLIHTLYGYCYLRCLLIGLQCGSACKLPNLWFVPYASYKNVLVILKLIQEKL